MSLVGVCACIYEPFRNRVSNTMKNPYQALQLSLSPPPLVRLRVSHGDLTESLRGLRSTATIHHVFCLEYMEPWLRNLASLNVTDEVIRTRFRTLLGDLLSLTNERTEVLCCGTVVCVYSTTKRFVLCSFSVSSYSECGHTLPSLLFPFFKICWRSLLNTHRLIQTLLTFLARYTCVVLI